MDVVDIKYKVLKWKEYPKGTELKNKLSVGFKRTD